MKDLIAKLQLDANCALGAIWMHIDAQAARIAELEAQIAAKPADTDKLRKALSQLTRYGHGEMYIGDDCDFGPRSDGKFCSMQEVVDLVASTALQAPVREVPETWISVEDQMPEQLKDVLIWEKYSTSPCIAYHNGRMWSASQEHYDTYSSYGPGASLVDKLSQDLITHWMPLPAAPAQEPKP